MKRERCEQIDASNGRCVYPKHQGDGDIWAKKIKDDDHVWAKVVKDAELRRIAYEATAEDDGRFKNDADALDWLDDVYAEQGATVRDLLREKSRHQLRIEKDRREDRARSLQGKLALGDEYPDDGAWSIGEGVQVPVKKVLLPDLFVRRANITGHMEDVVNATTTELKEGDLLIPYMAKDPTTVTLEQARAAWRNDHPLEGHHAP